MKILTDNIVLISIIFVIVVYFYYQELKPKIVHHEHYEGLHKLYTIDHIKHDFDNVHRNYFLTKYNCSIKETILQELINDKLITIDTARNFMKNHYPICLKK